MGQRPPDPGSGRTDPTSKSLQATRKTTLLPPDNCHSAARGRHQDYDVGFEA